METGCRRRAPHSRTQRSIRGIRREDPPTRVVFHSSTAGWVLRQAKRRSPAAFFFGIATWVAILLIIGVTALMIANSTGESTSAGGVIAIIPMVGTPLVVLPLAVCGLATGASAKKRLMTRKQLIMNRIGFWLSVAPLVIFLLPSVLAMIDAIVSVFSPSS